jgi:uncharacterized protein (TIGR02145 family)
MEWTAENLSTEHFLNGDLIPYAGSKEEWKKAAREKKPAWCYIDDDSSTNKNGKLYNWYAVNDSRGLSISKEYSIPSTLEWELLIHYMAYIQSVNFCAGDETIFQPLDSAGKNYERKLSPIFNQKSLTEFKFGMRREDGEFHNEEGSMNSWWCLNGFAGDDFWYCSPSIYYWGVRSLDEERKGWGFRVLLFKYINSHSKLK